MRQYIIQIISREINCMGEVTERSIEKIGPFSREPERADWAQSPSKEAAEWLVRNGFVRIHTYSRWVLLSRCGQTGGELERGSYDCTRSEGEPRVYVSAKIEPIDTNPYFHSPHENWTPPAPSRG